MESLHQMEGKEGQLARRDVGLVEITDKDIQQLETVPQTLDRIYKSIMEEGTDYGRIPGTPKPCLWKPGAELLQRWLSLVPQSRVVEKVEDWEKPFFMYKVETCFYNREGLFVGNCIGSANTGETRYAWRWVKEESVPKGAKKEDLETEVRDGKKLFRIPTPASEIFTLQNTILKMADKRSFVGAILKITGACYSLDTEVMTRKGWKRFDLLSGDDEVATRRDDGIIEFQKPLERQVYDFAGNMIAFGGLRRSRVDLLVTPNHNMLVRNWNGDISLKPASLLFEESRTRKGLDMHQSIVRTAVWIGQDMKFFELPALAGFQKMVQYQDLYEKAVALRNSSPSMSMLAIGKELGINDDTTWHWLTGKNSPTTRIHEVAPRKIPINQFLEFLGWYLSEGHCREDGVEISQTKAVNIPRIKELGESMGYAVGYYGHGIRFYSKQLREYCKQFGHCDQKFIPNEIKQLPSHRLRILLESLLAGDGTVSMRRGGLRYAKYTTTSRHLADDVQEIAIKAGFSSTICRTDRGSRVVLGKPVKKFLTCYDVTIVRQRDTLINRSAVRAVPYIGKVYCVTVPNHTLLVRRKGKYAWCGNSRIFTQDVEENEHSPEQKVQEAKVVGSGTAKPAASTGRKIIKYFETSDKHKRLLAPDHPLYEEFVNFCAALKKDHPELQYEFKREKTLEGEKISSVTFQNPSAEVEKSIVSMMTSIADSIEGS